MSTSSWEISKNKANLFDFLRLLFALLVILSHSYALMGAPEIFVSWSKGQVTGGEIAVDSFFIISGFLITRSFVSARGIVDFLRKRIARIYPGFLACWAFCIIIVGSIALKRVDWLFNLHDRWHDIRHALTLTFPSVPGAFPNNPAPGVVNGSLWTIIYEFECYLLTALLGVLGLLKRRLVTLLIFCGLVITMVLLEIKVIHPIPVKTLEIGWLILGAVSFWPHFFTLYLSGAVLYLYRDRIPANPWLALTAFGILLVTFFVPLHVFSLLVPVLGTYCLLYLAASSVPPLTNAAKYGDLSYGVYLYAFPIQQLLISYWAKSLNPLGLFLLTTPVTLGLAYISWHLVEKHFLGARRHATTSATKPAASG